MKFYPAWAEINLSYLDDNVENIKKAVGKEVKLAPLLKHDAFGHGAAAVAKRLMQDKQVAMFCLDTAEECVRLRREDITLPLLLLSDFYQKELPVLLENDVTVSLYSAEKARLLNSFAKKAGKRCSVHLRIDTNDEYDGIRADDFDRIWEELPTLKNLKITGLYTRVYGTYTDTEMERIRAQISAFDQVVCKIPERYRKNITVHAAGSESLYCCPEAYYDMVRPGISMFCNITPAALQRRRDQKSLPCIRQVMTIKARVESIYEVSPARREHLKRPDLGGVCRKVADLSIGWWDVCYLFLEKDGYAVIRGRRTRVITSPQMDRVLIDVSDVPDAAVEDEVVLLGEPPVISHQSAAAEQDYRITNFKRLLHTGERLPKRYTNWSDHAVEFPSAVLYHMRRELPKLDELLNLYGNRSLEQYIASLTCRPAAELEPKADVAQSFYERCLPLVGEKAAKQSRDYLLSDNCLLPTCLHHGADFDSEQIQGNLIFYRYLQRHGVPDDGAVPMLACGGVDMSSATYPRGIRCYSTSSPKRDSDLEVFRLPLFDNSCANMVVLAAPAFTRDMVEKLKAGIDRPENRAFLGDRMRETFRHILNDFYLDEEVLKQDSYAKQATIINRRLCREIVNGKARPDFIYIQMEDVVADLLLKDMKKTSSLIWQTFFNNQLRREILHQLDGETGCWTMAELKQMTESADASGKLRLSRHHGSCFFWGVSSKGRRIPLYLAEEEEGPVLRGAGVSGEEFSCPFTEETVSELLRQRKIYPGVFLIMYCLKFIRGYQLGGGCFQIEYTKKMKAGLLRALSKFSRYSRERDVVASAADDLYIQGPMFGMVEDAFGGFVQAGTVELIDRGGIASDEFHRLLSISFHDAAMIGTLTMYSEVYAAPERARNWHSELGGGLEKLYEQLSLSS